MIFLYPMEFQAILFVTAENNMGGSNMHFQPPSIGKRALSKFRPEVPRRQRAICHNRPDFGWYEEWYICFDY